MDPVPSEGPGDPPGGRDPARVRVSDADRQQVEAALRDDSPLVRVRGVALMGAVGVQRKGPPKRRRTGGEPRSAALRSAPSTREPAAAG